MSEKLTLYGPARELLARVRGALDEHMAPVAADGEGWKLGGGTVLAARWKHRESDDLDVVYHPDTETAQFDTGLQPALEEAGGKVGAWGELTVVEFGDQSLELMKKVPTPAAGHEVAILDSKAATVLSTVQILSGKLRNRALDPPVRDVYDIAVCGIEDPESLEKAVNGLYGAKLDSVLCGWRMKTTEHAANAALRVRGVPARLEPVHADPAEYAIQAAESAIYTRVTIFSERGRLLVETRCNAATRVKEFKTASALKKGFEASGLNEVLRANRRNPTRIRDEAREAMEGNLTKRIIELRPEQPPLRQKQHLYPSQEPFLPPGSARRLLDEERGDR